MNIISRAISFDKESEIEQINSVLGWILPEEECKYVKNGNLIKNIRMYLDQIRLNGYLRFFKIDFQMLKPYMTETSWKAFIDFKTKRQNDNWICPKCSKLCNQEPRWKCVACLFYFHTKYGRPQTQQEYLCFECFYIGL